jgi:DNA processing protein
MDKGLDIDLLACALALHAAAHSRPKTLAHCLECLALERQRGVSTSRLRQFAKSLARKIRDAVLDWGAADAAIAWQGVGRTVVTLLHPDYPKLLRTIATPPPVLFVHGDTTTLSAPQIAVVGSRNATPNGIETAHLLANELSAIGFVVTSGMARGIDTAAHRGALANAGRTIAVFGCGVDRIYPSSNARLAEEISENGALVSEFPLGARPEPWHFPLRNRIISGLTAGTLVVEAGLASGSLLTAQSALEQGREVFAVPGAIRNPLTKGCHALIKQGAQLVESTEDVVTALPYHCVPTLDLHADPHPRSETTPDSVTDSEAEVVKRALGYEPVDVDTLLMRTGLTLKVLSSILLRLELGGNVRALAGGYYELSASPQRPQ